MPAQTVDNLVKLEMVQTPETYCRFLMSDFPVWTPTCEGLVEIFVRVQKAMSIRALPRCLRRLTR